MDQVWDVGRHRPEYLAGRVSKPYFRPLKLQVRLKFSDLTQNRLHLIEH